MREPCVAADGTFVLESGEVVLYENDHHVTVSALDKTSAPAEARWVELVRFDKKAHVIFTTQRVLFAWLKWKSDRAGGSFMERRVYASVMERGLGKQLLGGQVRHPGSPS